MVMDQIIQSVLDWLGTERRGAGRVRYNWEIPATAFLSLMALIKLRDIRIKNVQLRKLACQQLSDSDLVATAVVEDSAQTIKIEAELKRIAAGYRLKIHSTSPGFSREQLFVDIDEIASFLESNTVFKLSDFKVRTSRGNVS
jgi:hypothetical protein